MEYFARKIFVPNILEDAAPSRLWQVIQIKDFTIPISKEVFEDRYPQGSQHRRRYQVFFSVPLSLWWNQPHYSYRRLSTGSSCDARVAGTVPKMIPTIDDTMIAMIADSPEMGK